MDLMAFLTQYLDHMVLGILGFMSFLMLAFSIERYFFFRRVKLAEFKHIELLESELTRNLTVISSVAANAPYIGLLGTVIGILLTFNAMGTDGNMDVNSIMVGLAMALKATAAGLMVAIPAILFYNGLMRKVDVLVAHWRAAQAA
ncbi:TonB-system energizer ExbB [Leucothrix mucor]|jgi:biopolymer transport protein ExbB|uniref:TonB-system energizer ExbB n=1 Tax=Leucothrix mucor TaxID=45248 RepID=UPI0003B70569